MNSQISVRIVPMLCTLFVSILISCSGQAPKNSRATDIIGGGRAIRRLVRNIPFESDFEKILVGFGYKSGANCIQEVELTSNSGSKSREWILYQGPCADFPLESRVVAKFSLGRVRFGEEDEFRFEGIPVARLTDSDTVTDFCFGSTASQCDLSIGADGSIENISIKTAVEFPEVSPGTSLEHAVVWLANYFWDVHFEELGLSPESADLIVARRGTRPLTSASEVAQLDSANQNLVGRLARYAIDSDLESQLKGHRKKPRKIYISNSCARPIRIILLVQEMDLSWKAHGTYDLEPNEFTLVDGSQRGVPLVNWNDETYVWGKTTDGSELGWEGHREALFDGKTYRFQHMNGFDNIVGRHVVNLTCD